MAAASEGLSQQLAVLGVEQLTKAASVSYSMPSYFCHLRKASSTGARFCSTHNRGKEGEIRLTWQVSAGAAGSLRNHCNEGKARRPQATGCQWSHRRSSRRQAFPLAHISGQGLDEVVEVELDLLGLPTSRGRAT